MARQHPGETVGSFVAEGLVEALSQPTPESQFLMYLGVYIVSDSDSLCFQWSTLMELSMGIPDAIWLDLILTGSGDLTWWNSWHRRLTVSRNTSRMCMTNTESRWWLICTGTAKSKPGSYCRMNSFFYACRKESRCAMRLLSYAMSKFTDNFDVYSCTYGLAKDKANTVRSQLFSLGINAYTLENSYFGRERNGRKEHYS